MIYAQIGFALIAAVILARRFAVAWRRESARIDRLLEEFNAEIDARNAQIDERGDDDALASTTRTEAALR